MDSLLRRRNNTTRGLSQLSMGRTEQKSALNQQAEKVSSKLAETQMGKLNLYNHMTNVITPTLSTLDSSIAVLNTAALKNKPMIVKLEEEHNAIGNNINTIDRIDQNVADTVLDANLGNQKLFNNI